MENDKSGIIIMQILVHYLSAEIYIFFQIGVAKQIFDNAIAILFKVYSKDIKELGDRRWSFGVTCDRRLDEWRKSVLYK